jgi:hypothetical protein
VCTCMRPDRHSGRIKNIGISVKCVIAGATVMT